MKWYFCRKFSPMLQKIPVPASLRTVMFFYIVLFIFSCGTGREEPDLDGMKVNLRVDRFEQDLFRIDPENPSPGIQALKKKYGSFFYLFAFRITTLGSQDSLQMQDNISHFVADTNFRHVYRDCEKIFSDFTGYTRELDQAFSYYRYYFPRKTIPRIVTLVTGFSYPVVADSSTLGVGLDMYLGRDYAFYNTLEPPLPAYIRRRMDKAFMVTDLMKGWAQSDFGIDESNAKLIDMMISQGRLMYFLDKIMPRANDTLKCGYTGSQLEWCRKNESMIWSFFIDQKILFSRDPAILLKFVNDGPSTNGFPRESPGNIGLFTGWQIVKAYMEKHSQVSLKTLMEEKDLLKIFRESNYKPAR